MFTNKFVKSQALLGISDFLKILVDIGTVLGVNQPVDERRAGR
jgi:hypothetical protein